MDLDKGSIFDLVGKEVRFKASWMLREKIGVVSRVFSSVGMVTIATINGFYGVLIEHCELLEEV